jgi:sulfotransferase family protein
MTQPDTTIAAVQNGDQRGSSPDAIADPVFLLSPPLSLASFACAMLGQHPQMHSLPETHLFLADTLNDWWEICAGSSFNMAHGLLRAVAQLYFGGQTEDTVLLAGAWLRRRLPFTTGYIAELLAEKVRPRMLVEKSPSIVFHAGSMQRAQRMFPQARFIHLLQHPRAHGRAVVAAIKDVMAHQGRIPQWLRQLACFSAETADEESQERHEIDPQQAWRALNQNICDFLDAVPESQRLAVRGEDLVANTDATLRAIAEWLGVQTDDEAIEAMKHPERSPYACFGPSGARYGDNALFLRSPVLPSPPVEPDDLDAPLPWREDGEGLSPEVKAFARRLGYE